MQKRHYNIVGFMLAAFSLLTSFVQTLLLPLKYSIPTFIITVFLFFGSLFYFFKANQYKKTIYFLTKLSKINLNKDLDSKFSSRSAKSEAELKEVIRLDQEIYDYFAFSYKQLYNWWNAYPDGLTILLDNEGKVIGEAGLWPLKKKTFFDLLNGIKSEKDITAHSLYHNKDVFKCSTWYFASIAIRKRFRGTKAALVLFLTFLQSWITKTDLNKKLKICSLAFSVEGERLLVKLGFQKYSEGDESPDHLPIYQMTLESSYDLKKVLEKILPSRFIVTSNSKFFRVKIH